MGNLEVEVEDVEAVEVGRHTAYCMANIDGCGPVL